MRFKAYILQIIVLMALAGCAYTQQDETSCDKSVPLLAQNNNNTVMQIDLPTHVNDFRIGSTLYIVANNMSDTKIQVTPDHDLKLFWLQDGVWVAVKTKGNYLGVTELIPTKSDLDPGFRVYPADLDITYQSDAIQVCIVLEGTIDLDGSQSRVVAIREVTLVP